MTSVTSDRDQPDLSDPAFTPSRFRASEERGARIGSLLKYVSRVRTVDEELMKLLGQRLLEVDAVGAQLAEAMRGTGPDRVSMSQFRQALAHGVDDVPQAPQALKDFFTQVEDTPDWLDIDLMNRGAQVYRRFGRNAGDVLLQLSLIGGYRFGGPADLLVLTGGLSGDMARRRLAETQAWTVAVTEHDAMLRDQPGWQLTVHVRAMHALVNQRYDDHPDWDSNRWGRPINAMDQAATLGLFASVPLLGMRALGVRITDEQSRAVMHLWKYIGWLLGIEPDWLFDTEREQQRFMYHVLRAQDDVTPAGAQLAGAIVEAQSTLSFRQHAGFHRFYEPRRLLSMLRPFLGREGLNDLDLPVRLPWAPAIAIPGNIVRYYLLGRTRWGRAHLDTWAAAYRDEQLARYFGDSAPGVGSL